MLERLRSELNINLPDDTVIRRTYAGYWQKAAGAFSWFFYSPSETITYDVGSSERVRDLVMCKKIRLLESGGIIELICEEPPTQIRGGAAGKPDGKEGKSDE